MRDENVIKLPKGMVEGMVKAHLVESMHEVLRQDPERLIRSVVHEAMRAKKDHYTRESVFESQVKDMIREVAQEEFRAFLQEKRPDIARQIREGLGTHSAGLVKRISERMTGSLIDDWRVLVHLPGER